MKEVELAGDQQHALLSSGHPGTMVTSSPYFL